MRGILTLRQRQVFLWPEVTELVEPLDQEFGTSRVSLVVYGICMISGRGHAQQTVHLLTSEKLEP